MSSFKDRLKEQIPKIVYSRKTHPKMAFNMHVAIPLYMYPSTGVWQPLLDAVNNNPVVEFDAIVNPNNGPGGPVPDSNYIANISQLNAFSNVHLIGYVHTSYGSRNLSDIKADIDTYESWSQYSQSDIQMMGIFVDESPTNTSYLPYMTEIYNHIKSTMTNGNLVWTNPGVPVDASFYNVADFINAYENTYDAWVNQAGNTSIPTNLRQNSTVLLHSYPNTTSHLQKDVDSLVDGPYYGALLTLDDDYSSFSSSWAQFVSEVSGSNREC